LVVGTPGDLEELEMACHGTVWVQAMFLGVEISDLDFTCRFDIIVNTSCRLATPGIGKPQCQPINARIQIQIFDFQPYEIESFAKINNPIN
jgi:hypothetical protein